jgi:hypothetical protein
LGPTADADNPDLLNLLDGVDELGRIATEKGADGTASAAGWSTRACSASSIRSAARSELEKDMSFDLLVCDDMGTEIADFIGLDSSNRR